MSRRPLRVDPAYTLLAGLIAVIVGFLITYAAIVNTRGATPPSTTYIVGPHGDDVTVAPRSAP